MWGRSHGSCDGSNMTDRRAGHKNYLHIFYAVWKDKLADSRASSITPAEIPLAFQYPTNQGGRNLIVLRNRRLSFSVQMPPPDVQKLNLGEFGLRMGFSARKPMPWGGHFFSRFWFYFHSPKFVCQLPQIRTGTLYVKFVCQVCMSSIPFLVCQVTAPAVCQVRMSINQI